jgi:Putative Ig domain
VKAKTTVAAVLLFAFWGTSVAQQGAAVGEPLSVQTTTLPKAYLRQEYRFQLQAQGGIVPLNWEVTGGSLPQGMALNGDGLLNGVPSERGQFRFVVTVSDSGKPARQLNRELVLQVLAPLLVEWSRYPRVTGQRVECAVKVFNQTEQDFDLTVIVLAVNEIGRATAVGYQHFTLKRNTADLELSFGENVPRGMYEVNVDVVGELQPANTIYRARLVTGERLQVQLGP